jgi:hypothetical protein
MLGNYRRKKILETLKDKTIEDERKCEILKPYEEYIGSLLDKVEKDISKSQKFMNLQDHS